MIERINEDSLHKETLNELKKIIDFCSSFVIKDINLSEKKETKDSLNNSNNIINIIFKIQGYENLSDLEVSNYVKQYNLNTKNYLNGSLSSILDTHLYNGYRLFEKNEYYQYLLNKYDVSIPEARISENFEIIKYDNSILEGLKVKKFISIYEKCRKYFIHTMYETTFLWQYDYHSLCKFIIVIMSIVEYINKEMEISFNSDLLNEYALTNLMYSYGLFFMDDLPVTYKRLVVKNINQLFANKGNDTIFTTILSIFGMNKAEVFKYYLSKQPKKINDNEYNFEETDLVFIRTPIGEFDKELILSNPQTSHLTYESVVNGDEYWLADKEEILNKPFNILTTKYYDIRSAINIQKLTSELSYFFNLMHNVKLVQSNLDITKFVSKFSTSALSVFDALLGVSIITLNIAGFEGIILKNEEDYLALNDEYYSNSNIPKRSINSSLTSFSFRKGVFESFTNEYYTTAINGLQYHPLEEFEYSKDLNTLISNFNENIKILRKLEEAIAKSDDYEEIKNLQYSYDNLFLTKINREIFQGYDTYIEYLKNSNRSFGSWVEELIKLDNLEYKEKNLVELINVIDIFLDSEFLNFNSLNNKYFLQYIRKMIEFFKSYTIELRNFSIFYSFDNIYDNGIKLLVKNENKYKIKKANNLEPYIKDENFKMIRLHSELDLNTIIFNNGIEYNDK